MTEERRTIRQICCEKHGFQNVKDFFEEWDPKLELTKLMGRLECGCVVWIASKEKSGKEATTEEKQVKLKQDFLRYAKRLKKKEPELAQKIEAKIDRLVSWYVKNKRDMTAQEFHQIVNEGEVEA